MFIRSLASSSRRLYTTTSDFTQSLPTLSPSASPALNAKAQAEPTHHLITQVRSAIGLTKIPKRTLEALGLHRLRQSVLHPFSGAVAGQILRVKELVTVKNVTEEEGRRLMVRRNPEGNGVMVSGRIYGGGKGLSSDEQYL